MLLLRVIKKKFLPTISTDFQAERWWDEEKNITYQVLWFKAKFFRDNIMRIWIKKLINFELGSKERRCFFSPCHEHGTKKKFWEPMRNRTSDIWVHAGVLKFNSLWGLRNFLSHVPWYSWQDKKTSFFPSHFNSLEWSRQNFSLQYQYNIKQTSDENKENISKGIIGGSNTKFSKLTSQDYLELSTELIM